MAFRRWIWVRDTTTGHHMDVDARHLDRLVRTGAVEPVPDYPVNEGQNVPPRRPKHNVNLGRPSDDASPGVAETPAVETSAAPASTPAPTRRGNTRTATAAPMADADVEGADK